MRPGKLVYRHEILVDLDDKEMVSLAEKEIRRGLEIDLQENNAENCMEEIPLSDAEMSVYPPGALKKQILSNLKELWENHPEEEE